MFIKIDPIYTWCLLIFMVIIILDRRDNKKISKNIKNNKKEGFTNKIKDKIKRYINKFYPNNKSSINLNKSYKSINGTYGPTPYMPCLACGLHFNCSSFPYTNTDNMNVCTKCNKNRNIYIPDKNINSKGQIYVMAKTAGRPRTCKLLKK